MVIGSYSLCFILTAIVGAVVTTVILIDSIIGFVVIIVVTDEIYLERHDIVKNDT